jgi:hydrophobic/amphiphilic exporter-1 (mainly G- bacteria), HAE1 family
MMALILSVGFVVDDAIVMLENIFRHMEQGEKPLDAALQGSREIGFTIVSMTLSLAAVFIPVLFMQGVLGRLFREFSVTICVAILISGIVSVTLTPMLCSRFLRVPPHESRGRLYRATETFLEWMLRVYDRTLQVCLRHRAATMLASLVVLTGTVYMFLVIPKGFIPDQDTNQIAGVTEASQGISFYQMIDYQRAAGAIIQQDPDVEAFMSTIGGAASTNLGGPNYGQLTIRLKPRNQRKRGVAQIIADLRPKLAEIPGINVYLQNPPTINLSGQITKSQYQFSMQSANKTELYDNAVKMQKLIAELPQLEDVTSNLAITAPEVDVNIDRDKAAAMQTDANAVESAFYDAYGQHWVSTIYAAVNEYKVLLELQRQYQADPRALSLLYFKSNTGTLIPLDTLAKVKTGIGPQSINHYEQLNAVTISFNLKPGASLGEVVSQIQKIAAAALPSTISTSFEGAAEAFESSLGNLWLLLIVAILVVYIVLGILYESYIHPVTILSGLPSAGFGALITLLLFHMDLNIYAFVGLIMLIGIVEKNAIMQIDFALDAERNQGMAPMQAIYQGCLIRFRPIMMTTMAALLGAVPIALGYGAGGEARQPLGLVVVGGLMFSQLVTLYLTPVFYTYMAALQDRMGRKKRRRAAEPVHIPA